MSRDSEAGIDSVTDIFLFSTLAIGEGSFLSTLILDTLFWSANFGFLLSLGL